MSSSPGRGGRGRSVLQGAEGQQGNRLPSDCRAAFGPVAEIEEWGQVGQLCDSRGP